MKTLSSFAVVFLSVTVITLACFRVPRAVVTEAAVSARAEIAMRQWQSEAAQLYQILAENEAPTADTDSSTESVIQLASATVTKDSNVSLGSEGSGRTKQAVSLESEPNGATEGGFDWNTMSRLAAQDADQWRLAADTLAPPQSTRRRSGWAWITALSLGGLSVVGLLVCHWLDPERTVPKPPIPRIGAPKTLVSNSWRETPFKQAGETDIGIAIPNEWIEIRQSLGFQLRRWGGWALVVTALVCVVRM